MKLQHYINIKNGAAKTVESFLKKWQNTAFTWPSNSTSRHLYYKEYQNTNLKRYMHPYIPLGVYCNIIYNKQDMKPIYLAIDRSMDKEDVINVHNGTFLSQEEDGNPASGNIIDGPRGYYAKWEISQTQKDYYHTILLLYGM